MDHCGGWEAVRVRVRQEIGVRAFAAWFERLAATVEPRAGAGADVLVIQCPDVFVRDWVRGRYGAMVERAGSQFGAIEYRVEAAAPKRAAVRGAPPPDEPQATPPPPMAPLPSFESFVAGPANALALEAARSAAQGGAGRCNPLVLTGPSGVGKTHLAGAIRDATGAALYRSAEEFTADVTQGIRSDRMAQIRERYRRAANLLILEDLQFLAGKRATQIELFHTVDHLVSRGRLVVVTAKRAPREIAGIDPDLAARLSQGLVAYIGPPERDTRRAILRAKAAGGGVHVPDACIELLAERALESVRDLLAGLNQVVARATLLERAITPELTAEALAAVEVPGRRRSLEEITALVARSYSLDPDELRSRSRKRRVSRPRQLAMYLCRRYTEASLADIGRAFGRDHSSVLYAIAAVERRTLEKPQLRFQLEALAQKLT